MGEEAKVVRGSLFTRPNHGIAYAGMPAREVYSLAVTRTHGNNSMGYSLYFPADQKAIRVAGRPSPTMPPQRSPETWLQSVSARQCVSYRAGLLRARPESARAPTVTAGSTVPASRGAPPAHPHLFAQRPIGPFPTRSGATGLWTQSVPPTT